MLGEPLGQLGRVARARTPAPSAPRRTRAARTRSRSPASTSCSQTETCGEERISAVRATTRPRISSIPGRRGELAAELEQCARALGLAALRLVEARVLERDGRVAGEHLEQAHVVLVELVEPELRERDDADHAGAVAGAAPRGTTRRSGRCPGMNAANSQRAASPSRTDSPVCATRPVMPSPSLHASTSSVGRLLAGELAAEGDRDEVLPVDDEHAAVVVIDQRAQLVRDREPDLAHVVQAVELAAQALEHLHVRDRAHGAGALLGGLGPLERRRPRRRRSGSCRAPSRSSSPPRRRRSARAGSSRASAPARSRSRRSPSRPDRDRSPRAAR